MKTIVLYACGGLLKSDPIQIQDREYPPDYRVPVLSESGIPAVFSELNINDLVKIQYAIFKPTHKFIVFENKYTAMIYALS